MKLSADELDAGLALVKEGGLCELLPPFIEVDALEAAWSKVRPVLERVDLGSYAIHASMTIVGPKQKYVVRPIQLLDPIDTILYSALVRRLAPGIESSRRRVEERSVFSYRFSSEGPADFALTNSYDEFANRVVELCGKYSHVVQADIADFFPNVYLHRLHAAIAASTGMTAETDRLEKWLGAWSTPDMSATSYGLPVGQLASNLLAEGLLAGLDGALARDYEFVRYVDDYFIFCKSQSDAFAALQQLGQRLILTERLHLNTAKTRIRDSKYVALEFQAKSGSQIRDTRDKFIRIVLHGDPYGHVDDVDLTDEQQEVLDEIDAPDLLRSSLEGDSLNLAGVGLALQVLAATRDLSALPVVVDHLPVLGAVSRQVGWYLAALDELDDVSVRDAGAAVLKFIQSDTFKTPYQVVWLLQPFALSSKWNNSAGLLKIAGSTNDPLVRRQALLGASMSGKREDLLELRQVPADQGWVHRAALYGMRLLTKDEREHIWKRFDSGEWSVDNCVTRSVIHFARQQLEPKPEGFDPDDLPF